MKSAVLALAGTALCGLSVSLFLAPPPQADPENVAPTSDNPSFMSRLLPVSHAADPDACPPAFCDERVISLPEFDASSITMSGGRGDILVIADEEATRISASVRIIAFADCHDAACIALDRLAPRGTRMRGDLRFDPGAPDSTEPVYHEAHWRIVVPVGTQVYVEAHSGDIAVTGTHATAILSTKSGDVWAEHVGVCLASTDKGNVWASRTAGGAFTSQSGDVFAVVDAPAADGKPVEARAADGEATVWLRERYAGPLTALSHAGEAWVVAPDGNALRIDEESLDSPPGKAAVVASSGTGDAGIRLFNDRAGLPECAMPVLRVPVPEPALLVASRD